LRTRRNVGNERGGRSPKKKEKKEWNRELNLLAPGENAETPDVKRLNGGVKRQAAV